MCCGSKICGQQAVGKGAGIRRRKGIRKGGIRKGGIRKGGIRHAIVFACLIPLFNKKVISTILSQKYSWDSLSTQALKLTKALL